MSTNKNILKENKKLYELLDALKLNAVPDNIDKVVTKCDEVVNNIKINVIPSL